MALASDKYSTKVQGETMKFFINEQEVDRVAFFQTFYGTSLNAKSDDITLTFLRVFAETILDKEKFDELTKNSMNFYTTMMFNRQSAHLVSGNLFRIEQEPIEPEIEEEVAA